MNLSLASSVSAKEEGELQATENEIPDSHLRVHFENGDLSVADLKLWIYGDVATWSEELDSWPNGTVFPDDQMTSYGTYVDIELAENPDLGLDNYIMVSIFYSTLMY